MEIVTFNKSQQTKIIAHAAKVLKKGGVVIVPSDTVYGIAVDATNDEAVIKLLALKSRPMGKAISVFCGNVQTLPKYVSISPSQQKIVRHVLPGPYTLVLPSTHKVSLLVEAENGTLGVRVPDFEFINSLVQTFGTPLTATSANRAGHSPHYSIETLLHTLSEKKKQLIDLVIDAGKLPVHKPSTVVDLTADTIKVLRKGDFAAQFSSLQTAEAYSSQSEADTRKIATAFIGKNYQKAHDKALIIFFIGNLGAGKTVFAQAVAGYFGIQRVVSPTFVIYYEYPVAKGLINNFIHADFYRLQDIDEFAHLGLEQYLAPGNIMCIEWAEKSGPLLNELMKKGNCVSVSIEYTGAASRNIIISHHY